MKVVCYALALVIASSSLVNGGTNIPLTTDGVTPFSFKASANVDFLYATDSESRAQNYVVTTKHIVSEKMFSSTNTVRGMYYKTDMAIKGKKLADVRELLITPGESSYEGWSKD